MPQLFTSVCTSTQTPLHSDCPEVQEQSPPRHSKPAPQVLLHSPQWVSSVAGSMQSAPHANKPLPQLRTHWPPPHNVPLVHGLPQLPQWSLSFVRLTHSPPHIIIGASHPVEASAPAGSSIDGEHAATINKSNEIRRNIRGKDYNRPERRRIHHSAATSSKSPINAGKVSQTAIRLVRSTSTRRASLISISGMDSERSR